MSIFREFNISMIPGKPPLIVHVSQYESDFVYTFHLVSGKSVLAIPETAIAVIRGTKRDGNGYSVEAALDAENHKVVVMGDPQLTACAGRNVFELAILNDEKTICTANFYLDVERAPLDAGTIQSESVLRELQAIINSAATATQAAEEASAVQETVIDILESGAEEAVGNWLEEHPEATTTLLDGAVTEPKLANALKLKVIKDYVTPEMFGAVGDGETDDTQALQDMFDEIASIKATKNITCFGKGRYKTDTITISGDRYSDAYSAQIIGLTFVCNNTLVFSGVSNHYNYSFKSCSFFADVSDAVLFNNYVFSHTSFENCYFHGFKHIIYGDVFIQMMKFDRCTFEDCLNVFAFTAVYTMYVENCIFTGCDHVFTQGLLNAGLSAYLRNIQRLVVNKCTFENYTDYAARLVCFSEVVFTNNYFDNGQGNGHGIIIASDSNYTRGRRVLFIKNNHVQMAITSVSPKLVVFDTTDIDCAYITDNYSYDTFIADLSNLTVNKKLIYTRNVREGGTQTFLFTPYRFTNMVLDEDLPTRQIGTINNVVYYFKMVKGKGVIYRQVDTGTVSVGDIKKITFDFTNNTIADFSQISPFDLNNNAKNVGCYNNNGIITIFEMVISSDYDSADNPVGIAVN